MSDSIRSSAEPTSLASAPSLSRPSSWLRPAMGVAASLVTLLVASAAYAQDGPAVKAPTPEELAARVADLEAYVTNGTPKALITPGPGHNGWMMVSTALVLFMTLPGLALFYGGLVRRKNVLSVMAQCLGCAGFVTILWWLVGYSFAFDSGTPFLGGLHFALLRGVGAIPNANYGAWVSHSVFAMYQLMFAIITPALIVGAIAERMKYSAIMAFLLGWMFVVYFPLAHMIWGIDGFMNGVWNPNAGIKAIDFAGGTVVHMSSGWSALVLCLMVGKRQGFGKQAFYPHSLVLTMIGTGMLWVGWYGFNAGSAVAADGIAATAFMATTLATAVATVVWPTIEWFVNGKPTVLGMCSGAVAGLVVVTPASGFITANGAVLIGLLAGSVPYLTCTKLKAWLKYDDALDTFGVHGVGGTLGALVTGFLATPEANPNLSTNLAGIVGKTLWLEQLKAMGLTLVMAVGGTVVLATIVKRTIGLRPDAESEEDGLDLVDHGEAGYHLGDGGGHTDSHPDAAQAHGMTSALAGPSE
ncbi:MAG TPA: ammonium transporter [Polyangiaceae bacterium]|jgi:Amt family ammonium transporter|nr:ammonium transporter [Polyangiaceae bacterium]